MERYTGRAACGSGSWDDRRTSADRRVQEGLVRSRCPVLHQAPPRQHRGHELMGEVRKHPLAKCEECPLQKIGRYVPSEGPEKAEYAFVGEAPGAQEAKGGRPFVGPSGKLLERVMEEYNIERKEVLLSSACLCRPPDNSTPAASAIAACRPRLIQELQDRGVGPVVALGISASQSLLGLTGVTKLRVGPGRPAKDLPDVRVI